MPCVDPLAQLVGKSPGLVAVREQIRGLLKRQAEAHRLPPILIQGETGTGKGLVARAMHAASVRAGGPFVDVNCAAIPETLLEAEMFGVERGAFTDARQSKPGLFQLAHRGTIFLDEIGLMPETLQAKLLKVIEEPQVRRLGGTRTERVNVWVVTATNEDLRAATAARRFRADLYHRLAVVTLSLPPLRDRGDDVLTLAEHFLARACADYGLSPKALAADARDALLRYAWPGNIRELSNVMERVVLMGAGDVITTAELGLPDRAAVPATARAATASTLDVVVGDVERQHVLETLQATGWNISQSATRLGISRNTLRYRIEKYGLSPDTPLSRRRRRSIPATQSLKPPAPATVATTSARGRRRLTLLRAVLITPAGLELLSLNRRTIEVLADKVQVFGGHVEELSSLGIVAVFGLEPVEDAPARAAHAAIALLNGVEQAQRDEGKDLQLTVAIHVDEFLVNHGPELGLDLQARSHTLAFLDSLLRHAVPGDILASGAAAPFLRRHFDLMPAAAEGAFRLGGHLHTAVGLRRRLVAFVGRQQELQLLRSRFDLAASGRGQVVSIAGDAGIGKSRLLLELRHNLAGQDIDYLQGQCVSYGSTIPFLPVLDMLRLACRIARTDTPEVAADKIRVVLHRLGLSPAERLPYLLHLLGLKTGVEMAELRPEVFKARVFEILRELTMRRSQRHPIVLVLEDLHWTDQSSEELFTAMVEAVPGVRVMLIATYRPGYRPAWMDKSYATQMALQPLPPGDSFSFVRALLGSYQASEAVVQTILAKAEGNPFFLEELTRSLREQRADSASLAVPDTVQEVLLARIDRLPPSARRLLQTAAVIGKDVPLALLEAIAVTSTESLKQGLVQLRAAEFLYDAGVGSEADYTFKHTLTHEVAYGSVAEGDRSALHEAIVAAIERLYADRLSEHVEDVGHHAFAGKLWDKALTYLRQAGGKAAGRSSHREAVACFEQALTALKHLPATSSRQGEEIDLRFALRTSLTPIGEHARVFDHLREAERVAMALGDQSCLGRVLAYLADYYRLTGDRKQAAESGERALAIAEAIDDFPLKTAVQIYLAQTCHDRGRYREAADYAAKNVAALTGAVSRETFGLPYIAAVHSRTWLVLSLAELGDFAGAIVRGEEALRMAEAADQPFSMASARAGLGWLYLRKGDPARARPVLERALELSRDWNIRLFVAQIAATLGSVYVLEGDLEKALPLLEQAVEQHAAMRGTAGQSIRISALADGYLAAQRREAATRMASRALVLARERAERGNEAYALGSLADIAAHGGEPEFETGERYYEDAIDLTRELGMRPLMARCRFGLALLRRRAGRWDAARESLALATALFESLDMPLWLSRTEVEWRTLR